MRETLSFSSRLIRALAVAFALGGMVLSGSLTMLGLTGQTSADTWLWGLAFTAFFIALYGWGENVREKPLFWLVPAFWLGFTVIIGIGMKGEGLILGLPLVLVVSSLVRRHYQRKEKAPLSEARALD